MELPSLLIQFLLFSSAFCCETTHSAQFAIHAILPLSGDPSLISYVSEWKMAAFAAFSSYDISNSSVSQDRIELVFLDNKGDPIINRELTIAACNNISVVAIFTLGNQQLIDDVASLSLSYSLPVISATSRYSNLVFHPRSTLLSIATPLSYQSLAVSAFMTHQGWSEIIVLHEKGNVAHTELINALLALPNASVLPLSAATDKIVIQPHTGIIVVSSLAALDLILKNSNIMDILPNNNNNILFLGIEAVENRFILKPPVSSHFLVEHDASSSQRLLFSQKTGISDVSSLLRFTIYCHDAISFIVHGINAVAGSRVALPYFRPSLLATLKSSSYSGYSGSIQFDENGFRTSGVVDVANLEYDLNGKSFTSFPWTFSGGLMLPMDEFNTQIQDLSSYDHLKSNRVNPKTNSGVIDANETEICSTTTTTHNNIDPIHERYMMIDEESHIVSSTTSVWQVGWLRTITLHDPLMNFTLSLVNNASNGYLPEGTTMALIPEFDQSSPAIAILAAQKLQTMNPIGVIGPLDPTRTIAASTMFGYYNIPELSPAASISGLSEKSLYPTFLRNGITDGITAKAIIGVLHNFGWNKFAVISSNDDYGVGVAKVIASLATELGMRLVSSIAVVANQSNVDHFMQQSKNSGARIVVFSSITPVFSTIIQSMNRVGYQPKAVVASDTLLSDGMSALFTIPNVSVDVFNGWISVNAPGPHGPFWDWILSEYNALTPQQQSSGFGGNLTAVITSTKSNIGATLDTNFIFADALRRVLAEGGNPQNGTQMLQALLHTNMTLSTGKTSFNSVGDRPEGPYDVKNIVNNTVVLVGRYFQSGTTGTYQKIQDIVFPDGTTIIPSDAPPRTPTWLHWSNAGAIVMAILASVGLLVVFLIFALIIWKRYTPIIVSSTWQFLVIMLLGSMLGYGTIFLWIGMPLPYICVLRIWLPPIAFILIIAPLLAKTWRLHRIFTLGSLKIQPISIWMLTLFAGILVLVQVMICTFWISLGSVSVVTIPNTNVPTQSFIVCEQTTTNRICAWVTFGYNGLCLLIGAYFAFKVRNLPKEYNESRFIGFCIYNSILFTVLAIILGYTLTNFIATTLIIICVCTWAIATGCICFMMVPKIWVLITDPEARSQHCKHPTTASSSLHSHSDISIGSSVPLENLRHDYSRKSKSKGKSNPGARNSPPLT